MPIDDRPNARSRRVPSPRGAGPSAHTPPETPDSRELMDILIHHMPVYMVFFNREGQIEFMSDEAVRAFGWTAEETRRIDTFAEAYPEPAVRAAVNEHMRARNAGWRDFPVRTRGGEVRDVAWSNVGLADGRMLTIGVDVTERRRGEERLRASEERFRALFDAAEDLICLAEIRADGSVGNYIEVNEAFCRVMGFSAEELKTMTPVDTSAPAIRPAVPSIMEELGSRGRVRFESESITKDGAHIMLDVIVHVIRFGGRAAMLAVARDITEQVRTREALRRSEERFREITETVREACWIYDMAQNRLTYLSPRSEQVSGLPNDTLIADPTAWLAHVHPDDRDRAARSVADPREGRESEEEYRYIRPDGETRWVRSRRYPVRDAAGRIVRVIGALEDITEQRTAQDALRRSEERFREIAENVGEAFWVAEPRMFEVTYMSPVIEAITGITSAEWMRNPRVWLDRIHPDDREEVCRSINGSAAGRPTVDEYRLIRPDGQVRWVRAKRCPVHDGRGNLVRIVGVVDDITESKLLQEERARLAAELLDVQEAERRRISEHLHDHVGQVLTLAQLELESLSARTARERTRISNARARLGEALASVRNLARSLRPPMLDTLGLRASLETLAEDFADSSGLAIEFRSPARLPEPAAASQTCLYRVLQEALSNIGRHAEARRVTVRLAKRAGMLVLRVADDGRGFDPRTPVRGIGLAGMKERLRRAGGKLEIDSAPGKGTRLVASVALKPPAAGGALV